LDQINAALERIRDLFKKKNVNIKFITKFAFPDGNSSACKQFEEYQ